MTYLLRYRPGTRYGHLFPSWRFGQSPTRDAAEAARLRCVDPSVVEIVQEDQ